MPISLDKVENITLITNEIAEAVYEGTNSDNSKDVSTGWSREPIIMKDPNGRLHGLTLIITDDDGEMNSIYLLVTDENRNLKLIPFTNGNIRAHEMIKDWVEIESTYGQLATAWITAYTNLQAAGKHINPKYVKFLHKELWLFMEKQYDGVGNNKSIYYAAVEEFKILFMLAHHFVDEFRDKISIKSSCFLCQYNFVLTEELNPDDKNLCPYCLADWTYDKELVTIREKILEDGRCFPFKCDGYDRVPPKIIRKLPWKEGLEDNA